MGHNGTDSKRKSPLAHLASLGSVHPCALGSCTAVFQGKVMRALVVVGGTGRGAGQGDPACVSVSPFYIFLSGLQGLVSVALQPRQGRWGWWLACISSSHGSLGPALSPSSGSSPSPPLQPLSPSFPSMSIRVLSCLTRLEVYIPPPDSHKQLR